MKCFKIVSALFVVLLLSSAFTLKSKGQVYIAGVAASFSDSIVFFTDVQAVDGVVLDDNGFLPKRPQYSAQLKSYIEEKESLPNRVPIVYFSESKEKLEKQMKKIKDKYIKNKNSYIRELKSDAFKFTKPSVEE